MREQRKVVTVLFADVVGSTNLASDSDPEVVRGVLSRYFRRISEIAQAHGGTVEKFAGDAAMVVFGVPTAHDDDAERAVRAAMEIRDGTTEVVIRVGINTGEAVTAATADRQQMVTGDTVNVAARLQQGAEPGEVVAGGLTERLTRTVIEYAPREPVVAKGKNEPLAAFRALRPRTQVPSQARGIPGLHSPLVGRDRELRLLVDTYARAGADRRLHLFTLIGAPGVGKSRLVDEALKQIRATGGRVLHGRCLPYGHGITYWPLIEILRADTRISHVDERDIAVGKLDRWLGELLPNDPQRPAIRARLSVTMGLEQPAAVMPDTPPERVQREVAWAVRRYVEGLARSRPHVVVVDDVQWAEPPMIEILEQLAERATDAPVLLVCVARPEFLEQHREWGAGKANSSTISLDPLSPDETSTLISQLLEIDAIPAALRTQIVERSAGTPLFCEELIRMLVDEGRLVREGSRWLATADLEQLPVPPSINAVLAARLDGLPEGDRAVLQAASVIGQRFRAGQVAGLFAGADVEGYLESLRRKGLVSGDDSPDREIQFSHILVRDAAYGSMTKSERASLHDRFATVLQSEVQQPEQMTEILAHHAERAFSLSMELGMEGDVMEDRARNAVASSLSLAARAIERSDRLVVDSALKIAREAAAKLPDSGGDEAKAQLKLAEAQRAVMIANYQQADELAAAAATIAEAAGLKKLLATARLTEAWIQVWSGSGYLAEFEATVNRANEACLAAGDIEGSIEARFIGTNVQWSVGDLNLYIPRLKGLAAEARAIKSRRQVAAILTRLHIAQIVSGELSEAAATESEVEVIARDLGLRDVIGRLQFDRAVAAWQAGDRERGEPELRQYLADVIESGTGQTVLLALRFLGALLMIDGRVAEAADLLDQALELSHSTGERWNRCELFALRAKAALDMAEIDEADRLIAEGFRMLRAEDLSAVTISHRVLGLVREAQGRMEEAELALRHAQGAARSTTFLFDQLDAELALAAFLARRGTTREAREALTAAKALVARLGVRNRDRDIEEVEGLLVAADVGR